MRGIGTRGGAIDLLASGTHDPVDLLVIGGGITGAGIALDAASRGLSVHLIERGDFASGTSSKSSKLVHGGLRYLEQREFGLVREAALERDLLRRLAPHLVEPTPFVLPVVDRWMRAKFGVGLWTYDALASFKNLSVHRYLGIDETEKAIPPLPDGKVKGGFLFYDCKSDDVRLVMEVLVQAVRYGAVVANYVRATGIEGGDDLSAVTVEDRIGDTSFELHAKRVVVAAGVWTDKVESLATPDVEHRLRPSKGVHLAFRRDRFPMGEEAAFIPDADRDRMLFVIPWLDSVIVGTTDTPYQGDIDHPHVAPDDRKYVLEAVNSVFDLGLGEADIAGAWAGLRPLVAGEAGSTADLSRRHQIYDIAPGVTGITGGKLTTYRRMAKDVVDKVSEGLGAGGRCKTHWIRLGSSDVTALGRAVERRGKRLGISEAEMGNLIRCYGDRALEVLDVAERDDLTDALAPGCQPLAAEAVYCAEAEMVIHLNDLLARRTRLALVDAAAGCSGNALEVTGAALGWDEARRAQEVQAHLEAVSRERGLEVNPRRRASPGDDKPGARAG